MPDAISTSQAKCMGALQKGGRGRDWRRLHGQGHGEPAGSAPFVRGLAPERPRAPAMGSDGAERQPNDGRFLAGMAPGLPKRSPLQRSQCREPHGHRSPWASAIARASSSLNSKHP
ncbi:hypothetical protein CC78DRAFT_579588 [Lojkania enalia]|uniref:Uncharacterized protein n=1 Tax=Lojkania enalia TaxID=147567 RepID=A0A9P4N448_9PLEO|nr:hypothetical protein CC78DRAFT_579588 [Didymosphaeria enalia]